MGALLKAWWGTPAASLGAFMLAMAVWLYSATTQAEPVSQVRILPVLEVKSFEGGRPHYGLAAAPQSLLGEKRSSWARYLGQVVVEAAQDLDLSLDLSGRQDLRVESLSSENLVTLAASSWVIVPIIGVAGDGDFEVTLIVVPPGSEVVLSKSQSLGKSELEVRVMVMLRDLVAAGRRQLSIGARTGELAPGASTVPSKVRSSGRAILVATGAALGGYTGFALQRASGSRDLRLTYPLAALGAGVGLGTAMVVSDEWDIASGEAWFIAGGAVWPNVATQFLAEGYGSKVKDRYVWGLLGSGLGLTLAATAVSQANVDDGDAVILHSASGFGFALGGMGELMVAGRTGLSSKRDGGPAGPVSKRGIGWGTAGGAVFGGVLATQVSFAPSRVLMLDVGIGLGGLGGAAALSPLLLVEREENAMRNRIWLSGIAAGMVAGGIIAYVATEDTKENHPGPLPEQARTSTTLLPYAGPAWDPAFTSEEGSPEDTSLHMGWVAGVQGTW